jgi:hypothetical protein
MAIDNRILQQIGVRSNKPVLDIFNSIVQDQRNAPLREQAIQQGQINTDLLQSEADFANTPESQLVRQQQQAQQIAQGYAQSLQPLLNNPQALMGQLQKNKQRLSQLGMDTSGIDEDMMQTQTPEGLAALAQEVSDTLAPQGSQKQFALQSSAPITNPSTGQVSTPVFNPSTGHTQLVPIEGAIQQTPSQKAEARQEELVKAADLDVRTTQRKETIKKTVARTSGIKKEFSERRRLAARSTRKIKEAQKLAEKATQGIAGVGKVQLGRLFPGIDTGNEVALSGAFKSLALDELQKFKGPTTDFEFRVTEDIAGSLGDGAFANKARLASLERANWFMDRESKQFNDHIKAGHDPDEYNFNFNELITPKKGGKSYSLQSLQDTAVANHISVDEVIKRLSR